MSPAYHDSSVFRRKADTDWYCNKYDRIYLHVPSDEYTTARKAGAHYDPEAAHWYISPMHPRDRFSRWLNSRDQP